MVEDDRLTERLKVPGLASVMAGMSSDSVSLALAKRPDLIRVTGMPRALTATSFSRASPAVSPRATSLIFVLPSWLAFTGQSNRAALSASIVRAWVKAVLVVSSGPMVKLRDTFWVLSV